MPPYANAVLVLSVVVAALAVARLTRLVTEDQILVGFRQWVVRRWGEDSSMSYLVHCPWCVSIYMGLGVMTTAVLWPNKWVIMSFAFLAASMVTGLLLDRKE